MFLFRLHSLYSFLAISCLFTHVAIRLFEKAVSNTWIYSNNGSKLWITWTSQSCRSHAYLFNTLSPEHLYELSNWDNIITCCLQHSESALQWFPHSVFIVTQEQQMQVPKGPPRTTTFWTITYWTCLWNCKQGSTFRKRRKHQRTRHPTQNGIFL